MGKLHSLVNRHQVVQDDGKGLLGVLEFHDLDFQPKRIYWLSEVPSEVERGHHAHKDLTQLILVAAGSVKIELSEGKRKFTYSLNESSQALLIQPGVWRVLKEFSPGSVVLVCCDREYLEEDYIRDWSKYLDWYEEAQRV